MQKYHDEPKQYKGYLKSALITVFPPDGYSTSRSCDGATAGGETPPCLAGPRRPIQRQVLTPVAVDRLPSPPRSWAKTAGSPQAHLSDARDRRDGLRQARV